MDIPLSDHGSRVQQIVDTLRGRIESGVLPAGTRLPGSRTLARDLGVARGTVVAAYEQLEAEGYCRARPRAGVRVVDVLGGSPRRRSGRPPAEPHPIRWRAEPEHLPWDLRFGLPNPGDFPGDVWLRLLRRASRDLGGDVFNYPHPEGLPRLRQAVAAHLRAWRGMACEAEDVLIVHGAQQAFGLIARALLPAGLPVAVEDPGYQGFSQAVRSAGLQVEPVPVDGAGLDVDRLARRRVSAAYVTPAHQFPSGVLLTAGRRRALLDWAATADALVIEDDYDSAYRFGAPPLAPLRQQDATDRVLLVGSFSKTMFPGLRLGYVVAPASLRQPLALLKNLDDAGSPPLYQAALAAFLEDGHYHRHLRRSLRRNGQRRGALIAALRGHFGDRASVLGGASGLHLVVDLGLGAAAEQRLLRSARERGIGVYAQSSFSHGGRHVPGLVLGFSRLEVDQFPEAVARLADAVAEVDGV